MEETTTDTQTRYDAIADELSRRPDVQFGMSNGSAFGASALKFDGKIFAMLVGESLVIKVAKVRADELVAQNAGVYFDPGHGRVMKQWVALDRSTTERRVGLAQEALDYALAQRR